MAAVTFTGGHLLQQKLKDMSLQLKKGGELSVGFLGGATYPSIRSRALRQLYKERKRRNMKGAIQGSTSGLNVATVAAYNEFGIPDNNQPARPFFRQMIHKESPHWGDDLGKILLHKGYKSSNALRLMGEEILAELKESILDLKSPPLAEFTVQKKGFDKPLIDTSHMINSADYEVK